MTNDRWSRLLGFPCFAMAFVALISNVSAQESFSQKLDKLFADASPGATAPLATDYEFFRRVYLDLAGRVPGPQEVRAFVADPDPNKRSLLIDRLLSGPEFTRHFAATLDVMLNERRADKGVPAAEWQKYLFESVAQNKPFDQLAREILAADGVDPALRPAVKFYLDRDGETNLLTRDVGRLFFGMDLQCAQCHDHPLIDDYYQTDYYGIYAFLNRSFVFTDKKDNNKLYFAEKADGDVNFASVFTKKAGLTGPRLPYGSAVADVVANPGEEYTVAPAENVRPIPKYSRRAQLAALATSGANRAFNRNIANRMWAHMMGRGLVEPVDLHHGGNPAAHPQVLDALADEMVRVKFDLRAMLRELAKTQTYQRSYDLPLNLTEAAATAAQQAAAWQAQQPPLVAAADQTLMVLSELTKQRDAANEVVVPIAQELAKSTAAVNAALQASAKANLALAESQKQLAAKQDVSQALTTAANASQEAVKRLPEDKELLAAAEKFTAKAAQLVAEVAAATKAANDLAGPAKAATDAVAAARNTTAEIATRLAPVQKALDTAKDQWHAAAEKSRLEQVALKSLDVRLADAQQVIQLNTLVADATNSRQLVEKSQAEIATAQQAMEKGIAALPPLQTELATAQKIRDEMVKLLAEATQLSIARQEIAKAVADAAAQADVARQKIPDDAELAQAAQSIKTRSEQLAAQVAELQKTAAARDQEAKSATEKFNVAQQAVTTMSSQVESLKAQIAALQSAIVAAQDKLAQANAAIPVAQQGVTQRLAERFYASTLRAQTPEQMAWSLMQVCGVVDSHRTAVEAELNKTAPLDAAALADPVKVAELARQVEAGVFEKLKGNIGTFVSLFGTGAGQSQEYFATVDQVLFFSNGGTVAGWLAPAGGNLTERLLKLDDPKALAEELYITVLSRKPTEVETNEVVGYVAARANEKPAAVQELAWGLLSSAEFRFNH